MIRRTILLTMAVVLSLSASALAAEPESGTIEGRIANGTAGGSSVAGQEVTLTTYQNDTEVDSTTAKTDAEGRFAFKSLSTGPVYSYQVKVNYQGADYLGERLGFSKDETTKSAEVTVYDSTTSDEAVKVTMAHTVIYVEEGSLIVTEYLLFVNDSDRTYIGSKEIADGNREITRFALPREATELQYHLGLMECCIYNSEDGFVETMPLKPGDKEVAYSYRVSYNSGKYTFARNTEHPTESYTFLIQGTATKVTSDQLSPEEPVTIEGTQFSHLTGSNLVRDEMLVVQLSGLPQTGNQSTILWIIITLVMLSTGLVFVYTRRKGKLQPQPVSPENNLEQKRQKLLLEIAQLDDDFEGGQIAEEDYRQQRAARKEQLIELMQSSRVERGNR